MYKDYFGLIDDPFSIAPNPQYLYMSERHREALAHLLYGVTSDSGFILLTGEVGTGKTTICRCLLEQIPDNADIALVFNPKLSSHELLAAICDELVISYPDHASIKELVDVLNSHLLDSHAKSRKTVLIIDEAQNLSVDVLEQLRLLTNLETNQCKLMQIILLGQPELLTLLKTAKLRQLSQRITARFHLEALNEAEVANYIRHRLAVAGARGDLFPHKAIKQIFRKSGGIPRLINLLCDRALLGTYAQNRLVVDNNTIDQAAIEVFGPSENRFGMRNVAILASLVLVSTGAIAWSLSTLQHRVQEPVPETTTEQAAPLNENRIPPTPPVTATFQDATGTVQPSAKQPVLTSIDPAAMLTEPSVNDSAMATTIPHAQIMLLDDILDDPGALVFNLAFKDLLESWSVDAPANLEYVACTFIKQYNLQCLSRIGSLRDLSHINRPAVITLLYHDGLQRYVTLSSLQEAYITLKVDGVDYRIDSADLLTHWTGEYLLLWQTPPGHRDSIKTGDSGDDIIWLDSSLSEIQQHAPRSGQDLVYDAILQEQVKMFQLSAGLIPDGIVGPKTWIQINSRVLSHVPLLTNYNG